jgi:hypothetical protein
LCPRRHRVEGCDAVPGYERQPRGCQTGVSRFDDECNAATAGNRAALCPDDVPVQPWSHDDHRPRDRPRRTRFRRRRPGVEVDLGCIAVGDATRQGPAVWARPLWSRVNAAQHGTPDPSAGAGTARGSRKLSLVAGHIGMPPFAVTVGAGETQVRLCFTWLNGTPRSAAYSRGKPSTRSPITLRAISVLPPPSAAVCRDK